MSDNSTEYNSSDYDGSYEAPQDTNPFVPKVNAWFIIQILLLVMQIAASLGRYYIRFFMVKRMGRDDLAHFITLVSSPLAYIHNRGMLILARL